MKITIHTDGGSRGNPGPSAIGVVIHHGSELLAEHGEYIGIGTNNQAEYKAVIWALQWLNDARFPIESVAFVLDSQLVVSQITGVFQIKHPNMKVLKGEIDALKRTLSYPITFSHVLRQDNKDADRLVNTALDAAH